MNKPEFTREQLCYLHKLLAISPCHTSGMHDPDHHLVGIICDSQRSLAWTHAMTELGFDLNNPERRLHDERCSWCHPKTGRPSDADMHCAWSLEVLLLPSYFDKENKIPHREVWWLAELPNLNVISKANLKQYLRAKKFPAPEDCNPETCSKKNIGWCPSKKCVIARELK